jgi:hypothetical protein
MSTELTTTEAKSLASHEKTIERGIAGFREVGAALMAISDGQLYRVTHKTFEAYCKERWSIERRRAYQLIDAAEIAEDLCTRVHKLPATEKQARPLASIPRHERADAWQEAVDTAPKDESGEPKVTAKHVEETVQQWKSPKVEAPVIDDDEPQMYDELEQVVPTNLIQVFHDGEMVDQTIGHLKAAVKVAGDLHSSRAGKFFNVKQFRSLAKEMQKLLESTRPFAICPYCEGRKCSACAHVGIVPKEVHQQAQ